MGAASRAEDDDWRVRAARYGPKMLTGGATLAEIAFGVEND